MSQVIVTSDKLSEKRKATATQEHNIDVTSQFKGWQKSDISGRDPVAALVGVAVLPILAFWFFLGGLATVCVTVVRFILKGLGAILGGTRNLLIPRSKS